jgi:chemotaxis protein CheD
MPHHSLHSHRAENLPAPVKGFEHIKRFWDPQHAHVVAKILPGECYISLGGEIISTVLGSCVSVCMRDPVRRVGGMNHFMLPLQLGDVGISRASTMDPALCYGNWAMEYLFNELVKQGAKKERMEVKVFGGGRVLTGMTNMDVGKKNIEFIESYLAREGFVVSSRDLGDIYPRKVLYFPDTGAVKVKKMKTDRVDVSLQEKRYLESVSKPKNSDIELF